MINRHTTFFVKDIKPIEFCSKPVMWQIDVAGAYENPFETQPATDEHDFKNCEGCQNTRKELIRRFTKMFKGNEQKQGFPLCCSHHSNLTKVKEFNRASFDSVPELVADKIIYTNQHIDNKHNAHSYYKDITDYIEYTVESFGKMPTGCGEPLFLSEYFRYVNHLVAQNTKIRKERKNRLLEFLEAHQTPSTKNKNTDINILLGTYQKWLKIFPFEISFFAGLKQHFEKQIPVLKSNWEYNPYTGMSRAKLHTKSSLIDALLTVTNDIITQINTSSLYENGTLTEPDKIKLELILNERKMKLKQGYVSLAQDEESRYRKILKEWFDDEKKFMDEIIPLVKQLEVTSINTNKKTSAPKLSTLITHQKSDEIVLFIKTKYRNIKGKRLKILLMVLQELELIQKERIAKKFHNCCEVEFDWDIASYNAMNGYNYNEITDSGDFADIKHNLETLIKTN